MYCQSLFQHLSFLLMILHHALAAPSYVNTPLRTDLDTREPQSEPEIGKRWTASCSYTYDWYYGRFFVNGVGSWDNNTQGYGRGFLDNLRGQCVLVTEWQFENDTAWFAIPSLKKPKCVQDAIWLTSYGVATGVTCVDAS